MGPRLIRRVTDMLERLRTALSGQYDIEKEIGAGGCIGCSRITSLKLFFRQP